MFQLERLYKTRPYRTIAILIGEWAQESRFMNFENYSLDMEGGSRAAAYGLLRQPETS
jgi:hypothetical protein